MTAPGAGPRRRPAPGDGRARDRGGVSYVPGRKHQRYDPYKT